MCSKNRNDSELQISVQNNDRIGIHTWIRVINTDSDLREIIRIRNSIHGIFGILLLKCTNINRDMTVMVSVVLLSRRMTVLCCKQMACQQ